MTAATPEPARDPAVDAGRPPTVTVTLNPSLDRTLHVAGLVRGEVLRAEATQADPGGKGVNVARALAANGDPAVAVFPVGGAVGHAVVGLLRDAGVEVDVVQIAGITRANVTVVEPDGTTTKLNEPGPELSEPELAALLAAVGRHAAPGGWVVVGGSLPPGVPASVTRDLGHLAAAAGASYALDTSGEPLLAGLGSHPTLVKPNREELAEAVGGPLRTLADVVTGCHGLRALGARDVLCSLGSDGALLVTERGTWHARGPAVDVRNTVGAGDALLSGFLHGGGRGPEALRTGVAWASAAVSTAGTGVPTPDLIHLDDVTVTAVDDPALSLLGETT